MANATHFVLLVVTAAYLALRWSDALRRGSLVHIYGSHYLGTQLFLLYGLSSVPILFSGELAGTQRSLDPYYLVYVMIMMIIGIGAGALGYLMLPARRRNMTEARRVPTLPLGLGFLVLALVDVVLRLQRIMSGEYFSWMRRALWRLDETSTSALEMLQTGFAPVLVALALFLYSHTRHRAVLFYLILLTIFVFLEGKRTSIMLFAISAFLGFFLQRKDPKSFFYERPLPIARILLIGAGVAFAFSIIIEMRQYFRMHFELGGVAPAKFLLQMTQEVLAAKLGLMEADWRNVKMSGAGFVERTTTYAITFATLLQEKSQGSAQFLGIGSFFKELTEVVPSVLWVGEKPIILSGHKVNLFAGKQISKDPATTILLASYIHLGVLGVAGLMLVSGAILRMLTSFVVTTWGWMGHSLMLGSAGFMVVQSNTFTAILVGLRNFTLLILVLYALSLLQVFIQRRRYKIARGPVSQT